MSTRPQMFKWNWKIFVKEFWRVKQNWLILNDKWQPKAPDLASEHQTKARANPKKEGKTE